MYYAIYFLVSIALVTVLGMVLPYSKQFRKLRGGYWYQVHDKERPLEDFYWTKFLDDKKSNVLEAENYSNDSGST